MGQQVAEAKSLVLGVGQFTTELAEFQGDVIVNMEASIATKLGDYLEEDCDVGRIGLGGIMQRSLNTALDDFYAAVGE